MTLATRLAVAMILLVTVTVAAVGWLGYRSITQAVVPRVLERVEAQSRLLANNLESYVAGVRGDLIGYRSAAAINGLIRAHAGGGIDALDALLNHALEGELEGSDALGQPGREIRHCLLAISEDDVGEGGEQCCVRQNLGVHALRHGVVPSLAQISERNALLFSDRHFFARDRRIAGRHCCCHVLPCRPLQG